MILRVLSFYYKKKNRFSQNLTSSIIITLANLLKNCSIDEGVVVHKRSSFSRLKVGYGTYITHNAQISNTTIGKFCSIGPNFFCGFGVHPLKGISTSPAFYSTRKQAGFTYSKSDKINERVPIIIGNDVFIGANVTVLDGVTIGDGAVVGAGTIVNKNIPSYAIAVGNPVKVIDYRFPPEVIEQLLVLKWWNGNEQVLQHVERHFFDVDKFLKETNLVSK